MDRFKFRVWNKQSNSYTKEKMFYINEFGSLFKYERSRSTVYINADSPCVMGFCGDNYIIEQCTGLKDKNGKLIYEGDILKSRYSDVMRYEVVYRNAGLCLRVFAIDKPETMDYLHIGEDVESIGLYEVISNIHENKDYWRFEPAQQVLKESEK